ncbi:MAG: hypothetical protein E7G18_00540 [Anaerococcus hydrogenalis]|uniref:hypothetical protein n=1 Tax=Anaerococcus hydrogenalis TaxID=33029 RepID=UPI002904688A|nr:hypothetical protein [Anaerococcus hydrogenalis]MDU3152816.1 hypothetical protein [Anaerococcus hydrogenalis]MDU3687168.1 hypothetical protein [Anaerococcus hydrogenalis]
MTKKELTIDDVNEALKKFAENEKNLDEKNPYLKDKGTFFDKIVEDFCESLNSENSNENFSWLEKFDVITEGEKYKSNVNYAMPTHVHGDYKNGLIYLCLKNPGMQIDDNENYDNIKYYYKALANKIEKSLSKKDETSDYYFYEQMDLEIKDNYKNLDKEMVKEYIYDEKTSILTKELVKIKNYLNTHEFDKKWKDLKKKDDLVRNIYYIWTYFKPLLERSNQIIKDSEYLDKEHLPNDYKLYGESRKNLGKVITNKVVNIELCPFRSKNADAIKKLSETDYGMFSAYIIWYRIGKYLNELEEGENIDKPVFILRSIGGWDKVLNNTLYSILIEYSDGLNSKEYNLDEKFNEDLYYKIIRPEYFYNYSTPQGTSLSQKNLRKFLKEDEFDDIKKLMI